MRSVDMAEGLFYKMRQRTRRFSSSECFFEGKITVLSKFSPDLGGERAANFSNVVMQELS